MLALRAYDADGFSSEYRRFFRLVNMETLDTISLPPEVTEVADEAFVGVSAQLIRFSGQVTKIGSKAFADCPRLLYIVLPAGTESIADDAFSGCSRLTICAPEGSFAQRYAEEHGFSFCAADE